MAIRQKDNKNKFLNRFYADLLCQWERSIDARWMAIRHWQWFWPNNDDEKNEPIMEYKYGLISVYFVCNLLEMKLEVLS